MPVMNIPGHSAEQIATIGDVWHLEQQGDLLAVAVKRAIVPEMPKEKRTDCQGFTASARKRMLKLLARIDWQTVGNCVFILLTYPDECIEDTYRKRSQHRAQLVRRIRKYMGQPAGMLWRIEWKPRQQGANVGMVAPHIHLCVFTTAWLPKAKLREWWGKIIGHPEPIVEIKFRKGMRAAMYAAKYAAKPVELVALPEAHIATKTVTGRHWGIMKLPFIPLHPQRYILGLTPAQESQAQALAQQFLGLPHVGGFIMLTPDAADLFDRIMGIGGTPIATGDAFE